MNNSGLARAKFPTSAALAVSATNLVRLAARQTTARNGNPGPDFGPTPRAPWAGAQGRMRTIGFGDQVAGPDFSDGSDCLSGVGRILTPEQVIGDVDPNETSIRAIDASTQVPGISATDDCYELQQVDYAVVGPKEEVRACISRLGSGGAFHGLPIAGVNGGTTVTFTTPVGRVPMLLGYAIDFGMNELAFNPFSMSIVTSGYQAVDTINDPTPQVVDRTINLRMVKNGGRLFFVFAARPTGMNIAMAQCASAAATEIGSATVVLTVPASIMTGGFQATLQPLQAFTAALAQFATGEDIY